LPWGDIITQKRRRNLCKALSDGASSSAWWSWRWGSVGWLAGPDPDVQSLLGHRISAVEWTDAKGELLGFDLDVMRIIAILKGYKITIQNLSFDSIIPAVQAGQCDIGASAFTITKERAQVVDFSDPYWESNQSVLIRADSGLNIITAFRAGNKIGAQRGTTGAQWVEDNIIKQGIAVELKLYETYPLAEQDLINKQLQAVVEDEPAAQSSRESLQGRAQDRRGSSTLRSNLAFWCARAIPTSSCRASTTA
jgi:ABC-type amino acid transport substrate-binding protein